MDNCTTIFGESIIFTVNPPWHGRSYKLHLEKQQFAYNPLWYGWWHKIVHWVQCIAMMFFKRNSLFSVVCGEPNAILWHLLNHGCRGRSAPGFLKLFLRGRLYMRVCLPLKLLITSGVMWHDMNSYDWLNKFYSYYMATVVVIVNGCGLGIGTRHRH